MNDYIERAAKVLKDPTQTSVAKNVASEVLRNAGFSNTDIEHFLNTDGENPLEEHMVFLA